MSTKSCNNVSNDAKQIDTMSLENIEVFGEIKEDASTFNSSTRVSDRLNVERLKAFKTLEKAQKVDFKKSQNVSNKENIKTASTFNSMSQLDRTDYVRFNQPSTINISDLITDETVNLESSSSCPPSAIKDEKISFEPAEMTGRSTLYKKDLRRERSVNSASRFSVNEILATSFAPKARNLCETLRTDGTTIEMVEGPEAFPLNRISTGASSSSFSFSASHSLPRTADMSLSKTSHSFDVSYNTGGTFSFTNGQCAGVDKNDYNAESFVPVELMHSQFLMDEISWAQEYAAIPTAALSKEAKTKAKDSLVAASNATSSDISPRNTGNSMVVSDPNFSVGTFFRMRSENLWNIVEPRSPEKCHTPFPLVDEDDMTTTNSELNSESNISLTPKIDNKTYSKISSKRNTLDCKTSNRFSVQQEANKSRNAEDNSYLLSISAIDRALCNLDLHTDVSEMGVVNEILLRAKKSRKYDKRKHLYAEVDSVRSGKDRHDAEITQNVSQAIASVTEQILENKENCDPDEMHRAQFSDTVSFTESMLDSTDMKQLESSICQDRSLLGAIEIALPRIEISELGHEADIDEFPSTPVKSPNRRVRRTKSPRDIGPITNHDTLEKPHPAEEERTPIKKQPSQPVFNQATQTQSKTLSSTRLESDKSSVVERDFGISPNISKSVPHLSDNTGVNSNTSSGSPAAFDCSPMSSPGGTCLSSYASSPIGGYHLSPNWGSATSEQRYKTVAGAGAVRKAISSPIISESGVSKYRAASITVNGAASSSNCSPNSVKSGAYAGGRSASRCSNSSEFSHRDGKAIPLKVTTLELSWASTKLRTDARKSMQVKNISNKRLVVRIEICGPGFQLVNSQSNTLTLQSQECRSIVVSFYPTVTGIAVGVLSFFSPYGTTGGNVSFLDIPLYGYGGHAVIIPHGILKGPIGSAFLPMGDLCELSHPLERTFKIQNKGPLLGFAIVCIDSIGLNLPRLCDSFEIIPRSMLIPPGHMVTIRVKFRPKRDDIRKIMKKITNVLTLANMRIICGDDANRQRMRRLVRSMTREDRAKIASNSLDQLWTEFMGEVKMVELERLKEKSDVTFDLLATMRIHEIAFTLNNDTLDDSAESTSLFFPDVDETVLFRTVCVSSPQNMLDPVDEMHEDSTITADVKDDHVVSSIGDGSWSVTPNCIELYIDSNDRMKRASLLIRNSFKSRQYFEVVCNQKGLLSFSPAEGYIEPDSGQVQVEVYSSLELLPAEWRNQQIMIFVHMENERITVPVSIINDN